MYSVYVTCSDHPEAERIASLAIEKRMAACANIFQAHRSLYWWDGAVQNDDEVAMILKTSGERYKDLETLIKDNHSYDVPCIVAMKAEEGNPAFLEWIEQSTKDVV